MRSTATAEMRAVPAATLSLMSPIVAAVGVGSRPSVIGLGLVSGAAVGVLIGSGSALSYIGSPAAVPFIIVATVFIVAIWSVAAGAVAHLAGERNGTLVNGLRRALVQVVPLMAAAVPAALVVVVLLIMQIVVFALTQVGDRGPLGELAVRPLALIALVYTLIFAVNIFVVVPVGAVALMVLPRVMCGAGPLAAYGQVRKAFWDHPQTVLRTLFVVIVIATAVAAALIAFVILALVLVSFAQLFGASEIFLLRFSEPLVADMFTTVTIDNLAAVVVMASGIAAAMGAAVGPSIMLGVAGATFLMQDVFRTSDETAQ